MTRSGPPAGGRRPLDGVGSIKTKLGVLILVTVSLAAALAAGAGRLGWSPVLTVAVAVVLALAVTQLLARGMTSPLREMTSAAQAMERGDYSRRVTASSADEVGDLARAFNTMAAQLDRADQQRRDLLANVSHELRTPISALQAVLENLVDGVSTPDPTTLRTALAQTERLSTLVADLLELSRVDAGVTPLRLERLDVRRLLDRAVGEAELGARDDLVFVVEVAPGSGPPQEPTGDRGGDLAVVGDPARLQQLLANLLANAAQHSPPGGRIRVHAGLDPGGAVVIDVLDEGPGIPPAQRAAVFERFETGRSAADGGTGLGLAIARWVTQLHGGRIEVADSAHGCDLRVTLPSYWS